MAISSAFVWGKGGAQLTPEQIAQQREIEEALLQRGVDTSPVGSVYEGLGRVANAAAGSFRRGRLDKAEKGNNDWNASKLGEITSLLSGGGGSTSSPSPIPMTDAAGEVAATSPVTGDVYGQFMDVVKAGGLTNPYGLAAVAATGRAESGWSPENVNRTWSDPSESGKPGTAGGTMSWRGPRYQALVAAGDMSPAGQARFFLQEDPALIQKLNGAKSVEEAQGLINQAWAFAGYDRPSAEVNRRLGYAKGYLPSFQGGIEVASLDPAAGMGAAQAIDAAATPSGSVDPAVDAQVPQLQQPEFDMGRFGPNINLAEMPPSRADITQQMQEQTASLSGMVPEAAMPPAPVAAPVQAPVQVAQAAPQPMAPNGMAIPSVILEVLSDPRASSRTRGIAEILLNQHMTQQQAAAAQRAKQSDPAYQLGLQKTQLEVDNLRNPRLTPGDQLAREKFAADQAQVGKTADINEYEYAKERGYEGSFVDFQLAQKKAGAASTNVNVGETDKFYENLDKKNAETFAAMSDSGIQARAKIGQIDRLEGLFANVPQGVEGGLKKIAGDWGVAVGEGTSDIQAASALLEKMVPEQRAPGSGPMSDADIKMFRSSLPRILNQPGGNQLIFQTMRGIAQYEMHMGEIADQVADRTITPAEGRKLIRELKNPLADFKIPEGSTPNEGWNEISPGVRVRKVN